MEGDIFRNVMHPRILISYASTHLSDRLLNIWMLGPYFDMIFMNLFGQEKLLTQILTQREKNFRGFSEINLICIRKDSEKYRGERWEKYIDTQKRKKRNRKRNENKIWKEKDKEREGGRGGGREREKKGKRERERERRERERERKRKERKTREVDVGFAGK